MIETWNDIAISIPAVLGSPRIRCGESPGDAPRFPFVARRWGSVQSPCRFWNGIGLHAGVTTPAGSDLQREPVSVGIAPEQPLDIFEHLALGAIAASLDQQAGHRLPETEDR